MYMICVMLSLFQCLEPWGRLFKKFRYYYYIKLTRREALHCHAHIVLLLLSSHFDADEATTILRVACDTLQDVARVRHHTLVTTESDDPCEHALRLDHWFLNAQLPVFSLWDIRVTAKDALGKQRTWSLRTTDSTCPAETKNMVTDKYWQNIHFILLGAYS